jgi:hypothetical protein
VLAWKVKARKSLNQGSREAENLPGHAEGHRADVSTVPGVGHSNK